MLLKDKRICITGAFGSLGAAAVKTALSEGARVVALDYASATEAPNFCGDVQLLGGYNLSDKTQATRAITEAAEALSGLDGLMNIAGGFRWETLSDGSIETWDAMLSINLRTAVLASQAALPFLTQQNSSAIVNISAIGALQAEAGMGAYAASKSAVARLTESLAQEMKGAGVRVNAVLPSIIDTLQNRNDMPNEDHSKWVTPEELAHVLAFLVSDKASAITGALLPVAGRV